MATNLHSGRPPAKPGAALRALRNERGWTLAQVSERTGYTVSVLSKIENDKIALTFDKLVRLSEGLGIDIAEFFGSSSMAAAANDTVSGTRRSITRAGEGRLIETARGNYHYLASDLANKRIVPILGEVFAREISVYGDPMRHPGEEFVYVLEGTLELHTEMYTPARLEAGDSVYFDSSLGHAYIAVGEGPCRILSICATHEEHLIEAMTDHVDTKHGHRIRRGGAAG